MSDPVPRLRAACLALALLPSWLFAQPGLTGIVHGRVTGPQGEPIAGVQVTLHSGGATAATALTTADGTYRVTGLPVAGIYRVICSIGAIVEDGPAVELTATAALGVSGWRPASRHVRAGVRGRGRVDVAQ
jgi:hypothetical protein